jgi:hypothetical protein
MSAPLAICAGNSSWLWTLAVGISCSFLCLAVLSEEPVVYGKVLGVLQTVLLAVVAGIFATESSLCWESDAPMIPMTLIVLSALSAIGGAERSGRVNCVLIWFLAILYIISLAAGLKDLKIEWIRPSEYKNESLLTVFLIPAVSALIPHDKGRGKWFVFLLPLFAAVIALWCAATLSPESASRVRLPFYEYSKSLSFLGIAERFEALVSVAITIGLFSLLNLLFSAAESMYKNGSLIAGIIAGIIVTQKVSINPRFVAVGALILWIIVPLLKSRKINRKK